MAELTFTAADKQRVADLFGGVKSNGQAMAAVASTLRMADSMRAILLSAGGSYREQAAKDIKDYADRLRKQAEAIQGSATVPVGQTWVAIKSLATTLWYYIRIVEQGMPPGESLGDGWGSALRSSLADLPTTISTAAGVAMATTVTAVKKTVKVAGVVAAEVGAAAGATAWAIVKPLLPVVAVVALGAAGYLVAARKGWL